MEETPQKKYKYWLPDEDGKKRDTFTTSNSVIIIGANGSGKSRLGAWIEIQDFHSVHRIAGQRLLSFSENIPLKSYSQAEDMVFYGECNNNRAFRDKKFNRWRSNNNHGYTTAQINDFDDVLAALLSLKNNEYDKYVSLCRTAELQRVDKPDVPLTCIDNLHLIWNKVLPHRQLFLEDSHFYASTKDNNTTKYNATQMSDGERSVLYFIAQVLCVPQNKILIIDEPELHLHRSIMNRLWNELEKLRSDCLFIYITHDTDFASLHSCANIIWVKDFDGQNWKLEKIESDNIPDELLLNVLGCRNNILFVEGDKGSLDNRLYSLLFQNYQIICCGSYTQVINRTKAFKANPDLHRFNVFGLIDRDYHSDYELKKYKNDGIYAINVAEVENLFVTEGLIRFFASHMGLQPDEIFSQIKNYIINTLFKNNINQQISNCACAEIKRKLCCANIQLDNGIVNQDVLEKAFKEIDCDSIRMSVEVNFQNALNNNDYNNVLKIYNNKGLSKSIGHFFGIENRRYPEFVIQLLNSNHFEKISEALSPYLPQEIPRTGNNQ